MKIKDTDRLYKDIRETVSLFGADCAQPYYITTGNPLGNIPHQSFLTDYFVVGLCIAGELSIELDGHTHMISANGLLALPPAKSLHFLEMSVDFRSVILFFDKYYLLKNINDAFILERLNFFHGGNNAMLQLEPDETEYLVGLLDTIKAKIGSDQYYKDDLIRTLIFYLLLEIAEIHRNTPAAPSPLPPISEMLYFRVKELIRINVRRHKDVKFYAGQLCVSPKHLLQSVKNVSGKTPVQMINESLVAVAMTLLSASNLNISQVSDELNFSSVSSFSRFFKKMTGRTPVEYRNTQK